LALTKYGSDVLSWVIVIAIVLIALAIWTDELWLRILLGAIAIFLVVFSLNFFRDPDRIALLEGRHVDSLVVSPADGKVVIVKEVQEDEYLKSKATMVSIFMSPLDVHVNRAPMTGVVEHFRYVKGEFLKAFEEASSHRNERAIIGLNSNGHKILFSQIAGYIARRIVCPVKVGDSMKSGERFGMIKFGSRVDLYIPLEAKVKVKIGDVVRSGETILAEFQ